MGACCAKKELEPATKDKQVKLVAAKPQYDRAWTDVIVSDVAKMSLHEHELLKMGGEDDGEWMCDGNNIYENGCKSGISEYDGKGLECWACQFEECNFDICKRCI